MIDGPDSGSRKCMSATRPWSEFSIGIDRAVGDAIAHRVDRILEARSRAAAGRPAHKSIAHREVRIGAGRALEGERARGAAAAASDISATRRRAGSG